jgi:hypothetical protein
MHLIWLHLFLSCSGEVPFSWSITSFFKRLISLVLDFTPTEKWLAVVGRGRNIYASKDTNTR